ncbi:MAG: hypothetical protein L0K74_09315 [Acidipropionibacterium acidipropionici]|nr:hypothetical protein [Acidipropionibacterium acidipropionici]
MTDTATTDAERLYLPLVDAKAFRRLFIDKLGWENPTLSARTITVDGTGHTLTPVAGYQGMLIWWCDELADRPTQRAIDAAIGQANPERLIIFTGSARQEWRWPRRRATSGANAKLLIHPHTLGDQHDQHLARQLAGIRIGFDEDPTLAEVLRRLRAAFDTEAEDASVEAARRMKELYLALADCGVNSHDAATLLARLLFLMFGDDTGMWAPDMFRNWLADHTTPGALHHQLARLFDVLDTDTEQRDLPEGDPIAEFRYVNGGLYSDPLHLPPLNQDFRDKLLDACQFDWALISPAIFGSMFQAIEDPKNRRQLGEHYTTETNIEKVIGPLFLDELAARLDRAWDNKGQLTRLWNDLGDLRIMDPACGCGNFLVVSYRELRALELQVIKRRRDLDDASPAAKGIPLSQTSIDVTGTVKVTLDHFYGIEIEEWPATIARVAMLLVDHLANQTMADEFGAAPDRLPIRIAPTIVCDNALRTDWTAILPPTSSVRILGNPPFAGHVTKDSAQVADLKHVWGPLYDGYLDYVTGWYKKAADYFRGTRDGRFAFVSTNSIAQGQPVPALFRPILTTGWRIRFAHQTFAWSSEAADAAHVHCVIMGFDKQERDNPILYSYPTINSAPAPRAVRHINPYLLPGDDIYINKRMRPLNSPLPQCRFGSMPGDGGNLIVEADQYDQVAADPVAAKYLRPFRMGRELVRGLDRWCLWMADDDFDPGDIQSSPVLASRTEQVRAARSSSRRPQTREASATPHLFMEIRQPATAYVGIPAVVSANRRYYTVARLTPDVIAGNKLYTAADPDGFLFGVISSSIFITWQKSIGGRLKSDLNFSNTVVWNNLPLPSVTDRARRAIIEAGQGVLDARGLHPECSLAQHYDPDHMDPALIAAHDALDEQVDRAFGATVTCDTNEQRQKILFQRYKEMTADRR